MVWKNTATLRFQKAPSHSLPSPASTSQQHFRASHCIPPVGLFPSQEPPHSPLGWELWELTLSFALCIPNASTSFIFGNFPESDAHIPFGILPPTLLAESRWISRGQSGELISPLRCHLHPHHTLTLALHHEVQESLKFFTAKVLGTSDTSCDHRNLMTEQLYKVFHSTRPDFTHF